MLYLTSYFSVGQRKSCVVTYSESEAGRNQADIKMTVTHKLFQNKFTLQYYSIRSNVREGDFFLAHLTDLLYR